MKHEPHEIQGERKRDPLDIVANILQIINKGGKRKTHIMYGANLNWRQLNSYLKFLIVRGLIVQDKGSTYHITQKGKKFLRAYKALKEALD